MSEANAAVLAEEIERDITDAMADLIFIGSAVGMSRLWDDEWAEGENLDDYPVYVFGPGGWQGGWKRPEWKARVVGWDSPAQVRLVQQLLIATYTRWDHEWRPSMKAMLGRPVDSDLIGDLRWLRNDLIHNKGIVKDAEKCVLLHWFKRGDPIQPTTDQLTQLADELAAWVTSMGGTPRPSPS